LSNKLCDVGLWAMLGVAPKDNLLPKGTWESHEHFVE